MIFPRARSSPAERSSCATNHSAGRWTWDAGYDYGQTFTGRITADLLVSLGVGTVAAFESVPARAAGIPRAVDDIALSFNPNKFKYLFGDVSSSAHNAARSNQLALEMKRLGILDNASGQSVLVEHFQTAVRSEKNIIDTFTNQNGLFEVRESLLIGPSGRAAKLETTFQVMPDGTRRFVTTIPRSGVKQ